MKIENKQTRLRWLLIIVMVLLFTSIALMILVSVKAQKPLHSGWYTHKQIVKRGYECKPFKGRVCMTYTLYQKLLTTKSVK